MTTARDDLAPTRRAWLVQASATLGLSAAGLASARAGLLAADPPAAAGEAERIARLEVQAKFAGLGPFGVSRTEHFLAVGNAPDGFRDEALKVCEGLGRVYLKHLRDRGFQVEFPGDRMMVVVLKDAFSYGALVGEAPGKDVGGHFDLDADRLVVFDFRPEHGAGGAGERINTFTLVHETTHLLAYNTGLILAMRDPGKCINEGLATYFEMWRRNSQASVGRVNVPRLKALRDASRNGEEWIETGRLLTEDGVFDEPATAQVAYGQSWLLMYHLLSLRSLYANAVAYLAQIRKDGPGDRLATFEKHFGPVAGLDDKLRRLGKSLIRELPAG